MNRGGPGGKALLLSNAMRSRLAHVLPSPVAYSPSTEAAAWATIVWAARVGWIPSQNR
jgi:hypothetical protein